MLLELLIPSVCPACDRPRRAGDDALCPGCRADLAPLRAVHGIPTVFAYERTARILVQRWKFQGRRDALRVLVEPLAQRARELAADGIVAIPRHWRRIRDQQSDPAFALARALGRRLGLPVWDRILTRTRAVAPQTGRTLRERQGNVRDSFRVRSDALRGRRVLLLDDVATTGATLREAQAQLWRRAKPRSITPIALAGTPLDRADRHSPEGCAMKRFPAVDREETDPWQTRSA